MPARYSHLPLIWLLSDARNDANLEEALRALPQRSGFIYRHYHLPDGQRRARFDTLAHVARAHGHALAVSRGEGWGEEFVYGSDPPIVDTPWLAATHDAAQMDQAIRLGAVALFLSPVFTTRSHPAAQTLGIHGFHVLAQRSPLPVIALGGMNATRARELNWPRWGAIDGLVAAQDA